MRGDGCADASARLHARVLNANARLPLPVAFVCVCVFFFYGDRDMVKIQN